MKVWKLKNYKKYDDMDFDCKYNYKFIRLDI